MTQRERFFKTINHTPGHQLLHYFGFTPSLNQKVKEYMGFDDTVDIGEYFGNFRPTNVSPQKAYRGNPDLKIDWDEYYDGVDRPEGSYYDENGTLHVPGSMYHFTHYVSPLRNIKTLAEAEQFPFLDVVPGSDIDLKQEADMAREMGKVSQCWIGHTYENSWQVRGYQEFLMDMVMKPEICHYILEQYCQMNIKMAVAAAKAGVDMIRTGDDVASQAAMMFSPDMWWEFIGSRWERVYKAAKEIKPDIQIWYHSDGNIINIIDTLVDIGVTVLNPVQPECMDIYEVKKRWGDKIVMDGAVGTQTTMPWGTTEDVKNTIRRLKETIGIDGGYIISPTHVLEPEVPVENILAFVEACNE